MGNWDQIRGQDILKNYFRQTAASGKVSHAYILEGEPGTPKRELASAFARMLQCEKGTGCGECHSCKALDSGNHPDVIWVTHEKPDTIRIDELRSELIEDMGIRPYSSEYKIYIVDEAEKMNIAAQNALLKTLEEPPYYGIILLLTVNSQNFLPTILSRSILLKCQSTGENLLLSEEHRKDILDVMKKVHQFDRTDMANTAADWKKKEIPFRYLMNLIRIWYRDILVVKSTGREEHLSLPEEVRSIREAAGRYSYPALERILQMADRTEQRIASNVSYELAMELLLDSMRVEEPEEEIDDFWETGRFPDFEEARFLNESYENTMLEST